jgi:hypothetical protein
MLITETTGSLDNGEKHKKRKQYVELIKRNSQQGSYCEACDPSWPNLCMYEKTIYNNQNL